MADSIMHRMQPFHSLTQRGQAARLRRLAVAALEHYPLKVEKVSLLTYHFNAIFRVDTADGRKFVLRVNLPGNRTLDEITAEMLWLAALRRDTDLVVPEPLARHDGGFVTTVSAAGVPEARHCAVFAWVAGRDLEHAMTPENYGKLGVFTTRLHEHAAQFHLPPGLKLQTFDKVLPIHRTETILNTDQPGHEVLTPERLALIREAASRAGDVLERVYRTRGAARLLHTDLHQWNMRLYRGQMRALDFDDCAYGHPVNDVGITLFYIWAHPQYEALRDAYRRGYESRLPWPEDMPGDIEAIFAAREILLMDTLHYENNPQYKKMLPRFVARAEQRLRAYLDKQG